MIPPNLEATLDIPIPRFLNKQVITCTIIMNIVMKEHNDIKTEKSKTRLYLN